MNIKTNKNYDKDNDLALKIGLKTKPFLTTNLGMLYNDDCLKVMNKMKSNIFDCIFADPPFNLKKDYGTNFNDNTNDYFNWSSKWIRECIRLLKDGGSFFIYAMPSLAVKFVSELDKELEFRHWIAMTMKGSFPRGNKLYPAHYALLYYTKGTPNVFNKLRTPIQKCRHCDKDVKDYGGHRKSLNPDGINLTDFWEDTSPNRHSKYKVRAGINELKITIPERAILMSTNEYDLVFDPFGGGGSTYQVCQQYSRRWIGTEMYDCEIIKQRLENNLLINKKAGVKPAKKVAKKTGN